MKAVVFHQPGGPEVLKLEEVPTPEPGPKEVLVRVRACALNHLDIWVRQGVRRGELVMPHISGSDVAGEVAEVGPGVIGIPPGQRVLLAPGLSCGRCRACLAGKDNLCPEYDILGYRSQGGYAEYVAVPEVNVIPLAEGIEFETAAAFPLVFLTAWHMLVTRAQLRPGEQVLVLAAGSGVGMAAIQIARLWGARVIATAGTEEKRRRARELGADEVVDHYQKEWGREVRRLTHGQGVNVVVEHVGEKVWGEALRALAADGRLVTCGATSGPEVKMDVRYVFARHLSILGSYMGSKAELLEVYENFKAGHLKPIIHRTYPLEEAALAQQELEASRHFGKIVLTIN